MPADFYIPYLDGYKYRLFTVFKMFFTLKITVQSFYVAVNVYFHIVCFRSVHGCIKASRDDFLYIVYFSVLKIFLAALQYYFAYISFKFIYSHDVPPFKLFQYIFIL